MGRLGPQGRHEACPYDEPHFERKKVHIMAQRWVTKVSIGKKLLLVALGAAAVVGPVTFGIMKAPQAGAQSVAVPRWQTAAGGKMEFEVASVRLVPNNTAVFFNTPLDAGDDQYPPTHGLFWATCPLEGYISFAYKLPTTPEEFKMFNHLPGWVGYDYYSIQARSAGDPTKDQMRLMMQSLLAERFKLVAHFETRDLPALALTLVTPGKPGPLLQPHSDGPPCNSHEPPPAHPPSANWVRALPANCSFNPHVRRMPDHRLEMSARDNTMAVITDQLALNSGLGFDWPLVDQTGLVGKYDYVLSGQQHQLALISPTQRTSQI